MFRDFLFIVIGFAFATVVPHLQNLYNHWRAGNEEALMTEWHLSWFTFLVEAIVIIVLGGIILFIDRHRRKKEEERERRKYETQKQDFQKMIEDTFDRKLGGDGNGGKSRGSKTD
jgi:type II secretory pathway component PulF